jgi:fatty acid desaturase
MYKKEFTEELLNNYSRRNISIYWIDMLSCALLFWILVFIEQDNFVLSVIQIIFAAFALYRLTMFVHEISHFKPLEMKYFESTWNILCGLPLMIPSYEFKSHLEHHYSDTYGTSKDPEYMPFHRNPRMKINFILGSLIVPFAIIFRTTIVIPVKGILKMNKPRFASINPLYMPQKPLKVNIFHNYISAVIIFSALFLVAYNLLPLFLMPRIILAMAIANSINCLRTLIAHRYRSTGYGMSFIEQIQDSTTFKANFLFGELFMPVGQRFHATHHLFPYIPYHNLSKVHQFLLNSNVKDLSFYKDNAVQVNEVMRILRYE